MEFEINLNLFKETIKLANTCIHKKPLHACLAHFKIVANKIEQKLSVYSFDLCNGLIIDVPCQVSVSGEILVLAQDIIKLLSVLREDSIKVRLSDLENNKSTVALSQQRLCLEMPGKTLYLSCLPTKEYVAFPSLSKEKPIKFLSTDFVQAINRVAKMTFVENTVPVVTGVNLLFENNSIQFTSTNGHSLATATISSYEAVQEKTSVTLDRIFCQFLAKFEELEQEESTITIFIDENNIVETNIDVIIAKSYFGKIKIISRVIQGTYPPVHKIIPTTSKNVFTVNRKELLEALTVSSCFSSISPPSITFCQTIFSEDNNQYQLELSCSANEKGDAITVIPVRFQTESEHVKFGINSSYMSLLLNNLGSEDVTINFNDSTSPIVIKGVNEPIDCLMLIMPMSEK